MKMPSPGTLRDTVAKAIYKNDGPMTIKEIVACLPLVAPKPLKMGVGNMRTDGLLTHDGLCYDLHPDLRKVYNGCEIVQVQIKQEIVQPSYKPAFRELQPKNIPSLEARRDDAGPVRMDFGFKNGSTDFNSRVGYVLKG